MSVSSRNRTKVLAEPVLDYLSDTQALTYMPVTSEYYLASTHSWRDYIEADSSVEAITVASELREHPKVELRGLEPLASCMPCLASLSGIVRGSQDGAGQNRSVVWQGPVSSGPGWPCSHLVSHWLRAGA